MQRELGAPQGAETLTYSFHFQISSEGGRQACSVEVQAPNVQVATTFFRQNWPKIEFHCSASSGPRSWRPPDAQASCTRRPDTPGYEARERRRPKVAEKKVGQ